MNNPTQPDRTHQLFPPERSRRSTPMSVPVLKRLRTALLASVVIAFAFVANAVVVKVDSTKNWQGYNNVTETNGFDNYVYGEAFALADLRAEFIPGSDPSGWPLSVAAVQRLNTIYYDNTDTNDPPFWNYPDGTPNKLVEANFYVDVFTNFAGQTVTFEGTVISNTLPLAALTDLPTVAPASYHVVAWVKEFTTTYGYIGITTTPDNLSAGSFSVTRDIGAGNVAQYGFYIFGPHTAPGSLNSFKGLGVQVEDSDPAVVTQPAGGVYTVGEPISLTSVGVGATELSYQWRKDGVNVSDGGTISGAMTTNLMISASAASDSGDYTLVVSDTAGSATSEVASVTVVNILITNEPSDMRVPVGSTVVFKGGATSPVALNYRWFYATNGVSNNIIGINYNPPSYSSGAATDTLTLTNVQESDTGTYVLRIGDGSPNYVYTDAELLVRTPEDYVNFLENPGFENDPTGADETPWVRFELTDPSWGEFQSSSDTYLGGDPVNVYEGNYVSFTSFNAAWSGIYQDAAAEPGQIFTADMWFYNAGGTGGDPIPGPDLFATNEIYLEVQFRTGPGGEEDVLQQYTSAFFTYDLPTNTWVNFYATNAGGFGGGTAEDSLYLEAPPETTMVRFQVTMHDIANSFANGSLYYDSASLLLVGAPADLTVTASGGNVDLSWQTQATISYQVQYKVNLSDPWTDGEVVQGDGNVTTRSYPMSGDQQRFYRVLTL